MILRKMSIDFIFLFSFFPLRLSYSYGCIPNRTFKAFASCKITYNKTAYEHALKNQQNDIYLKQKTVSESYK